MLNINVSAEEWCGERPLIYDPFKVDDFFLLPSAYVCSNYGNQEFMGNPRHLYKKLMMDADRLLPVSMLRIQVNDVRSEIEAAKNLFQKNWRLHSASWSDYEKKKVTGSTGSLKKL
jgi:hypothetical protein